MSRSQQKLTKGIWVVQVLFVFFVGLSSCGSKKDSSDSDSASEESSSVVVTSGLGSASGTTPIRAMVIPSGSSTDTAAFSLTTADTWTIQMTECLSGYSATVTNMNLDGLEVYKGDRNCLAKLTEFTVNGRTYFPTVADAFTTWQVGDVARFDEAGEPGVAPLNVAVMRTLGSPVTGLDTISYAFTEVLSGQSVSILWSTYGANGRFVSGVPALSSFTVKKTELLGFTGAEAGQFKFLLECTSTIGITNVCQSFDFTTADYKLIQDTYSSAPTSINLAAIFGTAGTSITLPGDRVAPGDQGTVNGGFQTVTLTGPIPLATAPNMLLVIRSGSNYQFINIDVVVAVPWTQSPYPTIALFPFDSSPSVTTDTSLHLPVSLTDNSTAVAPTPKYGQARAFSTSTTTMTTPSASKFNLMASRWTVEGWINFAALPSVNGQYWAIAKRDDAVAGTRSWAIKLRRAAGQNRITVERSLNGNTMNALTTGNLTVAINTWYHFAVVYNNGPTYVFFNGALISTLAFAAGPAYSGGSVTLGGAVGANAFNGRLDDVRFSQTVRYTTGPISPPTTAFDPSW